MIHQLEGLLNGCKISQAEKKLAPDIRQSFEQFQKDVSESEKIGSGAAKSFEKLEPESGTRYNDSGAPYRMEQDLLSDAEYKRNGYEYTTDHLGRLFTAEGDLRLKEHDGRLQIKDNIHDMRKAQMTVDTRLQTVLMVQMIWKIWFRKMQV